MSSLGSLLDTKSVSAMSSQVKHHAVATIGEFVGTTMFLFFSFAGAQVAISSDTSLGPDPAKLLYISLSFGFSLMVNVWVFYRISGALFNPAVTFALTLAGAIRPVRAVLLFAAQMVGGIVAAALADVLVPGPLTVNTSLADGVSVGRGLFIEAFGTAELVIAILMLAVEKHKATFLAPIGIGVALFIGHMVAVFLTGAGLNPARSFGPAVITGDFVRHHWIYWIGPGMGSIFAFALWKLMKLLEYESANPGQDSDGSPSTVIHHEYEASGAGPSKSGFSHSVQRATPVEGDNAV